MILLSSTAATHRDSSLPVRLLHNFIPQQSRDLQRSPRTAAFQVQGRCLPQVLRHKPDICQAAGKVPAQAPVAWNGKLLGGGNQCN